MGELWKMIQLVSILSFSLPLNLCLSLSLTLYKMIQLIRYEAVSESNIGAEQLA